ncbi:hypothetical protein M3Y95_00615000 [Aphelenchoides besseyi]|nr:hypothetical protein M3Y95_00615000 [Aphelenchoides besseyi]
MDQENNTSEAFENERHYLGDLLDDEGFISWKLDDCKSNGDFEISERLSIESENINVTPESVHSDPGYAHSTRASFASTRYSSNYGSQNFFYSSPISDYHHVQSKNQTLAQPSRLQNGIPSTAHGINDLNQTSPSVLPRPNNLTLQRTFSQAAKKNLPLSPVVSLSNGGRFTPPVQKKMTVVSAASRSKPPKQSSTPPPTSNITTTSNGQQKIWGLNPLTKSKKDCVARDADVFKVAKKRNQQSSKPPKSSNGKQVGDGKSNGSTKNGKQHANGTENGGTSGLRKFESKFDVLQKLTDLSTNEERSREVEGTNRRSPSLSVRSTRSDSSDGSAEVENGSNTGGSSKRSSRSNGQQSSGTSSPTTTQKTFVPSVLATSLLGLYQKPKTKRQKVKRPCADGIWVIIIALLINAYTLFSKGLFWVFDLVVDFVYLLFVAAIMLFRKVVSKFT